MLPLLVRQPVSVVKRSISTSPRSLGGVYFEKDFFPGPYPKTEEERLKAAKKYGMQPEDYKPWENHDKWGSGDYPEIQPIGEDLKSEYEVWDDKSTKTNFNEPLPMREYHYTDRFDYGQDLYPSSDKEMRVVFFGMIGTFVLLHYFCNNFFARHDEALPKQFPFTYEGHGTYWHKSNIKRNIHYTFEPAEPAEGSE